MSINLLIDELEQRDYDVRRSPCPWSYFVSIHNCRDDERPGGVDQRVEKLLSRYGCKGRWNPRQTALLVTPTR